MNQVTIENQVIMMSLYLRSSLRLKASKFVQDNYLEEAFKMRNLLEEFNEDHGVRPPTILGVREHIFTGRWEYFIQSSKLFFFFFILNL